MVYYLIFSSLIFASYLRKFGPEIERFLYTFFISVLFIFCAFRYEVGCDWLTYQEIFLYDNAVYFFRAGGTIEFGYNLLMIALKNLGFGFLAFNVAISLIFFAGLNALAQRNINPLFFLALAFPIIIVQLPMSGLRQAAAFGFLCFSFLGFIDRKTFKFLIYIVLAASFHSSAVIFFLLTPFLWLKFSMKNILFMGILSLPILGLIFNSSYGALAISRYVEGDLSAFGAYFRVGILFLIGVYFMLFMQSEWKKTFPRDYQFVLIGAIGMIALFVLILPVSTVIADRVGFYLWIPALLILARIQNIEGRYRQLMVISCFAAFFLMFLFWSTNTYFFSRCYDPYQIKFLSIDFLEHAAFIA